MLLLTLLTCLSWLPGMWRPCLAAEPPHTDRGSVQAEEVTTAAFELINERVGASSNQFFVYEDADSGFNHGFPSGLFGAVDEIELDQACVEDSASADGCTTDPERSDLQRGTIMRVSFNPLLSTEFAGLNVEEPENWGQLQSGVAYDLTGAEHLVFDVRTPTADGIRAQFGVAGHVSDFMNLPLEWTTVSISFASLGISPQEIANVHRLFTVATNGSNAPNGGTVLLDNIRFEPVPVSQQDVPSFPLANRTYGVLPRQTAAMGRVPIPPDQILRNLTTTYESSLALFALLQRGTAEDLSSARRIADAFHYALHHDNSGDPLPAGPDDALGLHNAYESGDLPLLNSQGAGAGGEGDVRLAGFSAGPGLCGASGFCLLLDGATGGNNAFVILSLVAAYRAFGDARYLDDARIIGEWIAGNLTDTTGTGFGGYYLGYPDEGVTPKTLILGKSVENNADIFAAFSNLANVESALGNNSAADVWTSRAQVAGDFVMEMFDPTSGCFAAGTVPQGAPASFGTDPSGATRGDDVINVFPFLDANTFPLLALALDARYSNQIDWRRPVQCILDGFAQTVTAGGNTFSGFNLVEEPDAGPQGIAWEFTAQTVVAMRFADLLYGLDHFNDGSYLGEIRNARLTAPFGDGRGLVAATLQDGDTLPPLEQCVSTPFQCIAERVGLAATAWAIFAEAQLNPLSSQTHGLMGQVHYYQSYVAVPGVDVHLEGPAPQQVLSDANGGFGFTGLTSSPWTLRPEKQGDLRNGISSLDAAYALQAAVGLRTFDGFQTNACDVTGNGTVSSLDAVRILQLNVGLIDRFPVAETCGSDWTFFPTPDATFFQETVSPSSIPDTCRPGAILYSPLLEDVLRQDFQAIVFGDCTANWTTAGATAVAKHRIRRSDRPVLKVAQRRATRSRRLRIPIYADRAFSFNALDAEVRYDPRSLRFLRARKTAASRSAWVAVNVEGAGIGRIAVAAAEGIRASAGSPILVLEFATARRSPRRGGTVWLSNAVIDEQSVEVTGKE